MTEKERVRIREIFNNPEYSIKRDAFASMMFDNLFKNKLSKEEVTKTKDKLLKIMRPYLYEDK
jgi:hypothetical protein